MTRSFRWLPFAFCASLLMPAAASAVLLETIEVPSVASGEPVVEGKTVYDNEKVYVWKVSGVMRETLPDGRTFDRDAYHCFDSSDPFSCDPPTYGGALRAGNMRDFAAYPNFGGADLASRDGSSPSSRPPYEADHTYEITGPAKYFFYEGKWGWLGQPARQPSDSTFSGSFTVEVHGDAPNAQKVPFKISQNGKPVGGSHVKVTNRTELAGAGKATLVPTNADKIASVAGKLSMTAVEEDRRQTTTFEYEDRGEFVNHENKRELHLALKVKKSTAKRCIPGKTGTLVFRDGLEEDKFRDQAVLRFCGRSYKWAAGKGRLAITIGEPAA